MLGRKKPILVRPKKVIVAEFFRTESGNEPVRDFLKSELSLGDRQAVAEDIRTVEYGWPIGMPVCRNLKNGLLEVRTSLGARISRVFFAIYGSRMILLHGFIKKDQKTPNVEMRTALDRKKALERRL
jgi:phage-related protein